MKNLFFNKRLNYNINVYKIQLISEFFLAPKNVVHIKTNFFLYNNNIIISFNHCLNNIFYKKYAKKPKENR